MKNRDKISMFSFITVCILLISLFASGISVFAIDNFNPYQHFNITGLLNSSDFPNMDISHKFVYDTDNPYYVNALNQLNTGNSIPDSPVIDDFVFSDFNYYYWTRMSFTPCNSDSFVVVTSDTGRGSKLYLNVDGYSGSTYDYTNGSMSATQTAYLDSSNIVVVDGKNYVTIGNSYDQNNIFNTNLPIYQKTGSVDDIISSIDGLSQINPNYSGSNAETSANNLYLEDAYFLWTTYDPVNDNIIGDNFNIDNIYNGFVTFNYQLTEYQKTHLNEFTINVKASISYSMKFTGHSDYKNWSGSYLYEAPLSQFNTGSLKYNFIDIFNSTGFTSYFNNNYTGEIDFSNSSFKLTMDAELVDNMGGSSSDYIDIYDFLNDKVRNQSKAITNNNNPYVPSDSDQSIQNAQVPTVQTGDGVVPTGNTNSVVPSGSGTVNVVQNNNGQLVNPKPVVDYIKNEMLPSGDGVGFVDNLRTATESNEFITLMSDTFSFVPQTVWNDLGFYFEIFLGILVASFVLRIILDLL